MSHLIFCVNNCYWYCFSVELLGSVDVKADSEPFTKRVRTGRLPPIGLYNDTISCILVSKFCNYDQCEKMFISYTLHKNLTTI